MSVNNEKRSRRKNLTWDVGEMGAKHLPVTQCSGSSNSIA